MVKAISLYLSSAELVLRHTQVHVTAVVAALWLKSIKPAKSGLFLDYTQFKTKLILGHGHNFLKLLRQYKKRGVRPL